MNNTSPRVPFVKATCEQIEKQLKAVASAKSAVELVEAQYQLFRMVWRLPIN